MHIAFCHDAVIPPSKYGGTERIIYWLAKALMELGHRTTILSRSGSRVPGAQILAVDQGSFEPHIPDDVDVVHYWSTPNPVPRHPFVVTIEGNGQPGERFHPNTIFISKRHAENHGARTYIYNGIDPNDYEFAKDRGDYLVFLAKASWKVKNLEGAIEIARGAGLPLEVMGSRDWPLSLHRHLPRIRGVRYRGMVGDVEKRTVLAKARALLFPVRWHEPFGIAITEALASGCPVLGTPYGSLPELVTSDVGVLSSDPQTLISAVKRLDNFHPERCRARVLAGLTHFDMARRYLDEYESVLNTGALSSANGAAPQTKADFQAQTLLPWGP